MTESNTLLRLDSLALRNFRCFAKCDISFHPDLTLLVAENGYGKTAILEAVGHSVRPFVNAITGIPQYYGGFDHSDVRLTPNENGVMGPAQSTRFDALGVVSGQTIKWARQVSGNGRHARTTSGEAENLRMAATTFRSDPDRGTPDQQPLPLIAFYGTGRLWSEHRLTKRKLKHFIDPKDRESGYIDCLSSSSSFQGLVTWFESRMSELGDARFATDIPRTMPLVQAVQQAIRKVLRPTGWCNLDWDKENRRFVVRHESHGSLPLSAMSDGVQAMIALIADAARRCASLNPHLGEDAATQTPGILMIDEVDMHLHPRWQQQVVALLREAFPALQMVLTTHSPHVLSTVDKSSIRLLGIDTIGIGSCPEPQEQTRGDESGNVLSRAMHVDPVPDILPSRLLSEYRGLVQKGLDRSDRAQTVWRELIALFGDGHHLLQEAAVLRDLQEFKREYTESAGGSK